MLANNDAERAVIGAVILRNEAYDEARAAGLGADDFADGACRIVFKAIERIIEGGGPIDLVTLRADLERSGDLVRCGGIPFLSELLNCSAAAANAGHYARLVVDSAAARRLHTAAKVAAGRLNEGCELAEAQDILSRALEQTVSGSGCAEKLRDLLRAGVGLDADGAGMSTGFRSIDNETGGLSEAMLAVIAAYSSTGKTAFAMTLIYNLARAGIPCAVFSLEMSRKSLVQTMIARHCGIPLKTIRSGLKNLNPDEQRRLSDFLAQDLPLFIDETARSSAEIVSRARVLVRKHGVKAIMIDYLQLLAESGENRRLQIDSAVRALKSFAASSGVAVILLSQLSRVPGSNDRNPRPSCHSLKESGSIHEAADLELLLWRPRLHQFEDCGAGAVSVDDEIQVEIAKNRLGQAGAILQFGWVGKFLQIGALERAAQAPARKLEIVSSGASHWADGM